MPTILKRTLEFRWEVRPLKDTLENILNPDKPKTENILQQKCVGLDTDDEEWISIPFIQQEKPGATEQILTKCLADLNQMTTEEVVKRSEERGIVVPDEPDELVWDLHHPDFDMKKSVESIVNSMMKPVRAHLAKIKIKPKTEEI